MPIERLSYPTPPQVAQLMDIWATAVAETHHFLSPMDFLAIKQQLQDFFPTMPELFWYREEEPLGFVGVVDGTVEMLFVHRDACGIGVGKRLLQYAIATLRATSLDVNEDNLQARGFYEHMGFVVVGRTPVDSQGRPYPILHMELRP